MCGLLNSCHQAINSSFSILAHKKQPYCFMLPFVIFCWPLFAPSPLGAFVRCLFSVSMSTAHLSAEELLIYWPLYGSCRRESTFSVCLLPHLFFVYFLCVSALLALYTAASSCTLLRCNALTYENIIFIFHMHYRISRFWCQESCERVYVTIRWRWRSRYCF